MKNRSSQDGRNDNGEKTAKKKKNYGPNLAMMKRNSNQKRLGGGGLSLEVFANAKSKSGYNPAVIKKQREFYKNAKCVNKYRKSQKQEHNVQQTEQNKQRSRFSLDTTKPPLDTTKPPQEGNQTREGKKIHKKNNNNSLQSIREAYEKKREEEHKAKMEKETLLQAKKEQREMSETLRKERREQMFKKTRSGQPVMKFRIEQILKTLQGSTK